MHNTAQLAGSTCYHTRGDLSVACNEVAVCMIGFKYDIDRCRESSGVCVIYILYLVHFHTANSVSSVIAIICLRQ